jgi:hypothetical protein
MWTERIRRCFGKALAERPISRRSNGAIEVATAPAGPTAAAGPTVTTVVVGGPNKKALVKSPRLTPRVKESVVRDRLAASLAGARTEVACSGGFVDILTPTELIEVKRGCNWKAALGQVLVYGADFPTHRMRIHLFEDDIQNFALAFATCERFDVVVTSENRFFDRDTGRLRLVKH